MPLFPAMNAGQIDVAMAGMSITEERKKQFSSPIPTMNPVS